jgi:hypothetical protein
MVKSRGHVSGQDNQNTKAYLDRDIVWLFAMIMTRKIVVLGPLKTCIEMANVHMG